MNDLIRRLQGDYRLAAQRRRWPIVAGAGLATALVAVVVAVIVSRDGAGESDQLPPCQPDDTWTSVELAEDPTHVVVDDGETLEFEVSRAQFRPDGSGGAEVVLDVAATNAAEPQPDTTIQSVYFSDGWIEGLQVDRVLEDEVSCWGPVKGDRSLYPGQKVIVTMGFNSKIDPTGHPLALVLSDRGALTIATPTPTPTTARS